MVGHVWPTMAGNKTRTKVVQMMGYVEVMGGGTCRTACILPDLSSLLPLAPLHSPSLALLSTLHADIPFHAVTPILHV